MVDYTSLYFWILHLAADEVLALKHKFIAREHIWIALCSLWDAVSLIPDGTPADNVIKEAEQVDLIFNRVGASVAVARELMRRRLSPGEFDWPRGSKRIPIASSAGKFFNYSEDRNRRLGAAEILLKILDDPGPDVVGILSQMNLNVAQIRDSMLGESP